MKLAKSADITTNIQTLFEYLNSFEADLRTQIEKFLLEKNRASKLKSDLSKIGATVSFGGE